jgi:hypothetical protein
MSLTSANLVGYLRGEFNKSAKLRVWMLAIQLAVALPAAISVVLRPGFETPGWAYSGGQL